MRGRLRPSWAVQLAAQSTAVVQSFSDESQARATHCVRFGLCCVNCIVNPPRSRSMPPTRFAASLALDGDQSVTVLATWELTTMRHYHGR